MNTTKMKSVKFQKLLKDCKILNPENSIRPEYYKQNEDAPE